MSESELKKTPGKDHVILAVRPISNGVQIHLEVEQGLVRLFGRLVAMGMEQRKTEARPATAGAISSSTISSEKTAGRRGRSKLNKREVRSWVNRWGERRRLCLLPASASSQSA